MIVDDVPLASQQRASRALWSTRVSLLLVAALVGGLAGHFAAPSSTSGGGEVTINEVTAPPGAGSTGGGLSIPKLVQKVLPATVSIDVTGNGEEDQGTGMIISKNGLVVTNNHVIAAAVDGGSITVTRSGTTKSISATLVGTNPIDDVALIRIDGAAHLPTVTFGNSNLLEAGDSVVAIGNALGLAAGTPTVTSGIVSALGRTVTASSTSATETLNNMIQTDAAINPGNSGGPLLDSSGDVIGMDTAVAGTLSDGENTQNIGFAIPTATIQSLLPTLMAGESIVTHGAFIGVEIESMNPTLQSEYGFTVSTGAVVMSVISGTGAAAAGVKQGDIIVGINNMKIESAQDVTSVLSSLRPGDVITLHIVRGSKHLTIKVTLGHTPSS
jgi:S1-C subfamily serine protease